MMKQMTNAVESTKAGGHMISLRYKESLTHFFLKRGNLKSAPILIHPYVIQN